MDSISTNTNSIGDFDREPDDDAFAGLMLLPLFGADTVAATPTPPTAIVPVAPASVALSPASLLAKFEALPVRTRVLVAVVVTAAIGFGLTAFLGIKAGTAAVAVKGASLAATAI